jgi:hypothetical protein
VREPEPISRWVAYHLPLRVVYWALIRVGVKYIHSNEVVPDVGFTEVLERVSHERH